jgi:hypothetical protein
LLGAGAGQEAAADNSQRRKCSPERLHVIVPMQSKSRL